MAAPKSRRAAAKAKPKPISIKVQKAKFKKFLFQNAEFSLLGHWLVPHSKFILYNFATKKCTQLWFTFGWIRDEPTSLKCTDAHGEHPVIRAFFRH